MTQVELIIAAAQHQHPARGSGNNQYAWLYALVELLTQSRTTQLATIRQWVQAYRAARQAALDGLQSLGTRPNKRNSPTN